MPLSVSLTEQIQKNILRAIQTTPGTQPKTLVRTLLEVEENVYGDDSDEVYAAGFEHPVYIEFNPPIKVVQQFGWWKAGESLPLICYIPYIDSWFPKFGDLLVVPEDEGYMSGTYRILAVKTFGQGVPLIWVANLEPNRS